MLPSAEVKIHNNSIFLEEGDGKFPLQVGERVSINYSRTFFYEKDALCVRPNSSGNSVEFRFSGQTRLERGFYPEGIEKAIGWEGTFGNDPNNGSSIDFNNPDPVLTVRYLGHPARDVLLPLMEEQRKVLDATRVIRLDLRNSGWVTKIIGMSPVVQTRVFPYSRFQSDLGNSGYPARALFYMTVGARKIVNL